MAKRTIPRKAVYRLSLYQRALQHLKDNTVPTVSSAALAKASGVKPTQLRKDLAYVGQFGTRGLGYAVKDLSSRLTDALGTTRLQPVILVGAGNLGAALLHYNGFAKQGFEIVAAFDSDLSRRAASDSAVPFFSVGKVAGFVRSKKIKMAILAVPGTAGQEVANTLVAAGIQGILNFSPIILQVPSGVIVNNVDLALELENLSYFIR